MRVYGGGGGTILPGEIAELQAYGVARIFSPEDGRRLGLEGMIHSIITECDRRTIERLGNELDQLCPANPLAVARLITWMETLQNRDTQSIEAFDKKLLALACAVRAPVVGLTGTGGAGNRASSMSWSAAFGWTFPRPRSAFF